MDLKSVIARLEALSHRLLLKILLEGTPRVLLVMSGLAVLTYGLDWWLESPVAARAGLLLVSIALIAYVAFRRLVQPLSKKPTIDELALMAEAADPSLNDQIISAIQLERDLEAGRAVESPEMIRAVVADTAHRFGNHSFKRSVDLSSARRPLLLGGLVVALLIGSAAAYPDLAGLWFRRQILLADEPWPQEYELLVAIRDEATFNPVRDGHRIILNVPERTPLQVTVTEARGKLPSEVELVLADASGDPSQRISMGRPGDLPYFQHVFPPLTRSIVFWAEGGDDDDRRPVYEVRVARAPRVTRFLAEYDYPDYTGLEDRRVRDANISAPEGTRVTMLFETNMPLDRFELEFENSGVRALTPREDGSYLHSFVVEDHDFYTYRLLGDNEVLSLEVPRYVVTAERDQAPRVSAEMPSSTTLYVTPTATIPLKGLASDDYGVTALGIRFGRQRGELDAGGLDFGPADLVGTDAFGQRQQPFFHPLLVSSLTLPAVAPTPEQPSGEAARPLREGDTIHFRYLVTDNRRTPAAPEPHKAFGDFEYAVQVLSPEDLERELAQRQVRLRGRVRDIADLVEARLGETETLLAAVRAADDGQALRSRFLALEQDQNRIGIELKATAQQFRRVYDGYLWNRLDAESVLTNKLIDHLSRAWRTGEAGEEFQVYGAAIRAFEPLVQEAELIGRLTVIMELFIRTAAEESPEIARRIGRAGLVTDAAEAEDQLASALELNRRLRDDVLLLVEKLEAWEDYIDVIQGFRDLLQSQEGMRRALEDLNEKK